MQQHIQIRHRSRLTDNQEQVQTYYYLLTGPDGAAKLDAGIIGSRWWDFVAGSLTAMFCETVLNELLLSREIGELDTPAPFPVEQDISAFLNAAPAPALPNEVAVVVRKRTRFSGRKERGRWFYSGISRSFVGVNTLLPETAAYDVVAGKMAAPIEFVQGVTTYTMRPELVVYDQKTNLITRATPITTCSVDRILRSQRRRQFGRGS